MKFSKLTKGLIAAATIVSSGFANAGVVATSYLELRDLSIQLDIDGDGVADNVDPNDYIDITSESRTSSASADINSVGGSSTKTDSTGVGIADPNFICISSQCGSGITISNNTVSINDLIHTDAFNYAVGDANVSGSALGGGASGFTYADAGLNTFGNTAGAQSNIANGLLATIDFTVNQTLGNIGVSFLAVFDVFVDAFADAASLADNTVTTVASASATFSILVVPDSSEGNPGAGLIFESLSFSDDLEGSDSSVNLAGQQLATSFSYVEAGDYQININQNSTSAVELVPEPASLAVFALGLLGLAGASFRRKA